MFSKVLVANRGEIAVRVLRALRELGVQGVGVYSEADKDALHVRLADEAVEIGPPAPTDSYLRQDRILDAAQKTGAEAIHPGYGFLSENAKFATACARKGLVFIGPTPKAMGKLGDKVAARKLAVKEGVQVAQGSEGSLKDAREAAAIAKDVGYPVMLKAAAGGGGKGMRRVDAAPDLASAFRAASSEASSAFGDGAVYLEKLIDRPRHVEIQVLADRFGHIVHLGERECSVQRRHQKLIEEAPSPAVDLDLRLTMGRAAVQAAKSVGYRGAGTVEFLLDPGGNFFFLEMNTRIQVEHPVTEMVYGVDLVREQLRIAAGEPMMTPARPLRPRGHAIECRLTAEDPFHGFLPATGRIEFLRTPAGPGVRWDGGVEAGNEVGLFYDPLLGKLITWGETREIAIRRMRRALDELVIVGLPTAQPFHRRVMDDPVFRSGQYHIGYIEERGDALVRPSDAPELLERCAIAAALAEHEARQARVPVAAPADAASSPAWVLAAREAGLRR